MQITLETFYIYNSAILKIFMIFGKVQTFLSLVALSKFVVCFIFFFFFFFYSNFIVQPLVVLMSEIF